MRPLGASDPRQIGPYRVVAELGRGGMGRVLLATAPDGRLLAVKQVHARLTADDGFRARFRREVAAARKVSGAFTAAVLDADTEAETPWSASALVSGPSLGAAVESAGVLPEESVRHLAAGLATALLEIHRVGLIHRDLKPANVLLTEDGPRVIDFGIARAAEGEDQTELTRTGLVVGSPGFMSPEQADGRELTPAGDVFALGAVLVAALTGRSPFTGTSVPQTLYNVVHTEPDLSAVPPGLRHIVQPCLAKDPDARPTPARLLELIGRVAPTQRPWPPAVHGLIAAQRADIDRLLGDSDRTIVASPGASEPAGSPTRLTPTLQVRRTPRSTPVVIAGLGAVGLLVSVVLGAAVYVSWPSGEPAAEPAARGASAGPATTRAAGAVGATGPDDKYLKMPICSEAAPALPLPPRTTKSDRYNESSDHADTSCGWGDALYEPDAWVSWNLKRTLGRGNGTTDQKAAFDKGAAEGTPEPGLGFGDTAYWEEPDPASPGLVDWTCELSVRDANLVVSVSLGGNRTASACRTKAKGIARAAIAAMPR